MREKLHHSMLVPQEVGSYQNQFPKAEVSIILPVHNEAQSIKSVITEFYQEINSKIPLKIVVVEDGSTDGTKKVLSDLAKKIPMELMMKRERRGYSDALLEGLRNVDTEYVFFTDSDGQHSARDFWLLYGLKDKYDIVSGYRAKRADALYRRIMSKVFQRMATVLFKMSTFRDITDPFKLMRTTIAKRVATELKYMKESFWTEFTIRACKDRYQIAEVPANHRNRLGGSTRVYKPSKIPRIVYSQFVGLLKLWIELRNKKR